MPAWASLSILGGEIHPGHGVEEEEECAGAEAGAGVRGWGGGGGAVLFAEGVWRQACQL